MNLNPFSVAAFLAGAVLLYAAVKNEYPQDVIREALGKPRAHGPLYVPPGSGYGAVIPQASGATLPPATGVPVVTV